MDPSRRTMVISSLWLEVAVNDKRQMPPDS